MKKIVLFLITIFMLGGISAKSQDTRTDAEKSADEFIDHYGLKEDYSRFYIRTSVSYDHGLCNYDPCDYYDEDQGVNYDYLTTVKYEPGTGLDYDLFGGYHVNRFVSVGLGFDYFHGLNINQTRTGGGGEGSTYSEKLKLYGSMISVRPTVELTVPGCGHVTPFVDFGLVVGIVPRIMEKETNTTNYGTSSTEINATGVYHGGIPFGFDVKGGFDYQLSKMVALSADLNFLGLNYTPTKYSMKTYTVNGVDQFSTLTTKQKETVFEKSYDKNESIPADSPNKQLKQSFPFTGFGIDIGVKINLGSWQKF